MEDATVGKTVDVEPSLQSPVPVVAGSVMQAKQRLDNLEAAKASEKAARDEAERLKKEAMFKVGTRLST